MKLVDVLAGESPVGANRPVGTVVISDDGAGDQTVGSSEVNGLVGWVRIWSAPTGGQAKQQVVAQANRSQASKNNLPRENRSVGVSGNAETVNRSRRPAFSVKHWVEAAEKFPVVSEGDMLRETINESSEPVVGRLGIC